MAQVDTIRERIASKLTRFSERWSGIGTIYLQTYDEEENSYSSIYSVVGKWAYLKTDRDPSGVEDAGKFSNGLVYIAEDSPEIKVAFKTASHVLIGSDRYVINRPDTTAPNLAEPYWKVYCDHVFI